MKGCERMLLQFSVENFKSFKEKAVLSMEASSDKDLKGNFTMVGKDRILHSVVIFGANAAGKSNLFLALTAAILTVRESNSRQINNQLTRIVPFAFDDDFVTKPTSFEFVFITEGKKYVYGFSATKKTVVNEYLYVYNSSKAATIFERNEDNYKFTSPTIRKELLPIVERNTGNKLFLATATAWNCDSTRIPYLWIAELINTCSTDKKVLTPLVSNMFDDDDDRLRIFTNKMLQEADINISDYVYESTEVSREEMKRTMPAEIQSFVTLPPTAKNIHIETIHTIENRGGSKKYSLSMSDESSGTQNLFMFSPVLKQALDRGETICIDEFDMSLHPLLVIYLIKLFNNPDMNRFHAQLIVSSHSMELLSLNHLRRDQIYFVEKKRKTGESELYSLDEFSPRNNEDVRRNYLNGRYGALPYIQGETDLWQ